MSHPILTDPDVMADLERLARSIVAAECRHFGIPTPVKKLTGNHRAGEVGLPGPEKRNAPGLDSRGVSSGSLAVSAAGREQTPDSEGRGPSDAKHR